jgi:hypothetical protein
MSGFTMTQNELLHAFYGVATTSVVSASAVTTTAGTPEIVVPAGFMSALGKRSSSLVLDIGGYLTATATVPTWSFGVAFTAFATPPAFSAAAPLCTPTLAVAPTAGSGSWNLHLKIGLRTLGTGNASTVWASGSVTSNLFAAAPLLFNPAGSGGTTVTNWQSDQEYYLWPYLTLGAATAGNTVTTQYAKLYGEN